MEIAKIYVMVEAIGRNIPDNSMKNDACGPSEIDTDFPILTQNGLAELELKIGKDPMFKKKLVSF